MRIREPRRGGYSNHIKQIVSTNDALQTGARVVLKMGPSGWPSSASRPFLKTPDTRLQSVFKTTPSRRLFRQMGGLEEQEVGEAQSEDWAARAEQGVTSGTGPVVAGLGLDAAVDPHTLHTGLPLWIAPTLYCAVGE